MDSKESFTNPSSRVAFGDPTVPSSSLSDMSSMMLLRKIVGYYETQQSTEGKRCNRKKAAAYLILVNKVAARILAFVVSYVAFFVSSS